MARSGATFEVDAPAGALGLVLRDGAGGVLVGAVGAGSPLQRVLYVRQANWGGAVPVEARVLRRQPRR